MLFLCLVLQLYFVAARASVVFEDCGSAYILQSVNIQGCGLRLPCYVTLGDRIPVNVQFYADFESNQLDQDVTININYIHARTAVTPEPCESVACPVQTYAVTSFTSVMSVPTNMALDQRGTLQWRVYNEFGMQVLCYSVLVQTQTYLQKILRNYLNDAVVTMQDDYYSKQGELKHIMKYTEPFNKNILLNMLYKNITRTD